VKGLAGILEMVLREVRVSCLPGNIPEYLEADVTNLNIHDVFTVKDLKVPEGVRVLNDPNQAVVTVPRRPRRKSRRWRRCRPRPRRRSPRCSPSASRRKRRGEADKAGGEKKK
jgi:hypothetical protein